MNRNSVIENILLYVVSFSLMVFEYLLLKELSYLYLSILPVLIMPLVMVGFCVGSALSAKDIKPDSSNAKVILISSCSILFSQFLLPRGAQPFPNITGTVIGISLALIWPFAFYGVYFGRVFSKAQRLKTVFLVQALGLVSGTLLSCKIFKYFGITNGFVFTAILLLLGIFFLVKEYRKIAFIIFCIVMTASVTGILEVEKGTYFKDILLKGQKSQTVEVKYTDMARTEILKIGDMFGILSDGAAYTPVFKKRKEIYYPYLLPYFLRDYKRVLVIGSGGGNDLAAALKSGAERVVGVEVNPATIYFMKNYFGEYSDNIYLNPKVETVVAEGRSYVQNSNEKFDLIVLFGTDSGMLKFVNSSVQIENYLYTKEAIQNFWDKLSDKGVLFIARMQLHMFVKGRPLEILRIYNTIKSALPVEDIDEHLVVVKTSSNNNPFSFYEILLSKNKITEDIRDKLIAGNFEILQYAQSSPKMEDIALNISKDYKIDPISDDTPFFYVLFYWPKVLKYILTFIVFLLFFSLFGIYLFDKKKIRSGFFFMFLGIAYMGLEINIMEKITLFLGNPILAIQVGLVSFLLFGGWGGYCGVSLKKDKAGFFCFVLSLCVLAYIVFFGFIYNRFFVLPQAVKALLVFFVISPLGFLAGIPFAIALSRQDKKHISYALDGIGTIIGSLLVWFFQSYFGFNAAFCFIAIAYFLAGLLSFKGY